MLVRRAMVLIALLAVLSTTLLGASPAVAGVWLPPAPIVRQDSVGGAAAAMNRVGDSMIVWGSAPFIDGLNSRNRAAGGAWQPPVIVPGTLNRPTISPQLGVDERGRAYLAWTDKGDNSVRFATRLAPGPWTAFKRVDGGASAAGAVDLAVTPDGRALVVWTEGTGISAKLMARRRSASGVWGSPQPVSPAGVQSPAVAMNARGDAVAVWTQADPAISSTRLWSSDATATGTWSDPEKVGSPGTFSGSPSVGLADDGEAALMWKRDAAIELSTRPVSRVWQLPTVLSAAGLHPSSGTVAMNPQGAVAVVWSDDGGVHGLTGTSPGAIGSTPALLSAHRSAGPIVRISPSRTVFAVWGADSLVEGRVGTAGGAWGALQTLSSSTFNSFVADVAFDGNGNGLATWRRARGMDDDDLQASGYDGAPPRLTRLSPPATAVAGSTVDFAVSAVDVWSGLSGAPAWSFGDGAAAAGAHVHHTYTRPGTYAWSDRARDALGQASAISGSVAVRAPVLTLGRTKLTARYRRSHERGPARLRVSGHLAGTVGGRLAVQLEGPLRPSGHVRVAPEMTIDVPAGTFAKTVTLAPRVARRLLPGAYTLTVGGRAGGAQIPDVSRTVRVKKPPEGVVLRTRVATSEHGKNLLQVSSTRDLWVFFTFARGAHSPRKGLRIQWIAPGRSKPVFTFAAAHAFSHVTFPAGFADGRWRMVLMSKRRVVAVASIRVG